MTTGSFVRARSGTVIANNLLDMTDAALDNAILEAESGNARDVNVWTGTSAGGLFAGNACLNWQSSSAGDTGRRGNSPDSHDTWTSDDDRPCSSRMHLYCFEVPTLFVDGFESGDASAREIVVP